MTPGAPSAFFSFVGFFFFLSQARTTEPLLPHCVRLMLRTKRQTRCETRHSHVRKRSHALPLAKHTHLHTHTHTLIPPLSVTQQARRRRGQRSKPQNPEPQSCEKPFNKQLNLSSIIPLPRDHHLHRHYLHVVICQRH